MPPTLKETYDALKSEVEANNAVDQSAITLINGFAGRIDAAVAKALADNPGIDPAVLQGITDEVAAIRASNQALAAAVAANTPAAPGAGGGAVPVDQA